MIDRLKTVHGEEFVNRALEEIRGILVGLYGDETGTRNYEMLTHRLEKYVAALTTEEIESRKGFDPSDPYKHLDGTVFAIAYPDNIYEDSRPTLKTLADTLKRFFPAVGGIHVLPERLMSHDDVWPQDFLHILSPPDAVLLIEMLQEQGILDDFRRLTVEYETGYETMREELIRSLLPAWLSARDTILPAETAAPAIMVVLDAVFDSHFNDGGFSQISRKEIDPRFGTGGDLKALCDGFRVMLDYVVNHMDINNPTLEAFRRGTGDAEAFLVISPDEYLRLSESGDLDRTFRPRPFPLFTGLRKYPAWALESAAAEGIVMGPTARIEAARRMNREFTRAGLAELDPRIVAFLSIVFKIRNDQGLTAADRRIFHGFLSYLEEKKIDEAVFFADSRIQANQKILAGRAARGLKDLLWLLETDEAYGGIFQEYEEEVFGEKFYVYTTFSESQPDLNPVSEAGFHMIIDDLFTLLESGDLAMMRMDAIKYLWKEIGKQNFDMEEGNRLIRVIRLAMRLAAPRALPLDEVNSPDQEVYGMLRDGGFAYLFGQVNAVPSAFNSGDLGPIRRYWESLRDSSPEDFVAFVMLSTHDGRSVQGVAPQRSDGHISIAEFYELKNVVESRGGRPKYRSVPKGEIPADTFTKTCREIGLGSGGEIPMPVMEALFESPGDAPAEVLRLKQDLSNNDRFLSTLAEVTGRDIDSLAQIPAVDYVLQWMIEGRTVYELCCTSKDAFSREDASGRPLSPESEAARLALAQMVVLTLGQTVPAVYFNDLLGLGNDFQGHELSGKPRDLNRKKSYLPSLGLDSPADPFLQHYLPLINSILSARSKDRAYYPGSPKFEYMEPGPKVFLCHPYARNEHSFILGNIADTPARVVLDLTAVTGMETGTIEKISRNGLQDILTGETAPVADACNFVVQLPSFGARWWKPVVLQQ